MAVLRAPVGWGTRDWRRVGFAVIAVGTALAVDQPINDWLDANRSQSAEKAARTVRPLGQEGALALLGATWLAGKRFHKADLVAVSQDSLEAAIIAAGVVTPLLKAVSGRARPRTTSDAQAFARGGESFPSGETTMAFAIASVIAAHAESHWVDAAAWSAATLIGLERMTLDAHWTSDVVAGAIIGTAVGNWVSRRNESRRSSSRQFTILPTVFEHGAGLAVAARF